MLSASLNLVLIVLGFSPSDDLAPLVDRLGSPRFVERESAEVALFRQGRSALALLKAARNSKDLEVQSRALSLIGKIESSLLFQPTMVPLDFSDVSVGRILTKINDQSGLSLALNPPEIATVQGRRITVKSLEPLPFWKAVDALCVAGELHYIPGAQVPFGQRDGTLLLHDGLTAGPESSSDFGPFRVLLNSVHYQSEIQLSDRRDQPFNGRRRLVSGGPELRPVSPDAARQLFLQLLVVSEPRLSIAQNGPPKLTVAIDDKGQSLLDPLNATTYQMMAGYNGLNAAPVVRVRIDLSRPEVAGQKIRLIRGTIPVTVASRKSDPLEIPITGSAGKTFENDDVALSIQSYKPPVVGGTGSIEISVTQQGPIPAPLQAGAGEPLGYRPDTPQQQIEIVDAEGKSLPWFPSGTFYNGEQTRLNLTIVSRGIPAVPATIRYHSMIRASTEIPFEFRNLPMP